MVGRAHLRPWAALVLSLGLIACGDDGGGADEVGDGSSSTGDTADTTGDTADAGDTADTGETGQPTGLPEPELVAGCDAASFYAVPEDPAARGPWAVGAKTVIVDGLTTEVWYPAAWGSEIGLETKGYDIRLALPASEQGKIADALAPPQPCDCYDQLPIDDAHGPYPVVVFIHGTASWRSQSLTQMSHWASRGFVVVSSDHPGLWLADILGPLCGQMAAGQNLSGDTDKILAALAAPAGELAFLAGRLDTTRVAISGHSAGGSAAANQSTKPNVRVSIPMAAGQPSQATPILASTLFLGGLADGVVNYSGTQSGYQQSPAPKRLVGIDNAGHLAFSDICELENDQGQNILEIAVEAGVCGAEFAGFLFDCDPNFIDAATAKAIINYSTTAVLEAVLKCSDAGDPFAELQALYPDVAEYQQEL